MHIDQNSEIRDWPLLRQALEASASGDVDRAIVLLGSAGKERPQSALPQFLLGAELAEAGRADEAEAAFANAVLLGPHLHMARFQLGLLQFTSGRFPVALVSWQPLLSLGDSAPLGHFARAFTAWTQDQPVESREWFEKGLLANVDNAALNTDMRFAMHRLLGSGAPASPPLEPAAIQPDGPATSDQEAHVLLSNYRSLGSG